MCGECGEGGVLVRGRTHTVHCCYCRAEQGTQHERVVKFDLECERDRIEYGMISQMGYEEIDCDGVGAVECRR